MPKLFWSQNREKEDRENHWRYVGIGVLYSRNVLLLIWKPAFILTWSYDKVMLYFLSIDKDCFICSHFGQLDQAVLEAS